MGTLIGLLGLSRSALDAEQNAINTTANNVANQNTVGYTRQVVSFTDTDSVALSGFQTEGQWVNSTATSQRDRVLEQRLQQATATSTSSTVRLGAMQTVESSFGLSSSSGNASSTQLGSAMDGFFASLSALTANPTDSTARNSVLTAATTLAAAFNQASASISNQTAELNGQIVTAAGSINSITQQIAQLNGQISTLSPTEDAGSLEDQRQADIQQLSGVLGVNVIRNDDNSLTLTASNGTVLVSGTQSFSVGTTTVSGNTELVAGDPPVQQSGITGGAIGGAMQARDQDLSGLTAGLDQLAYSIGSAVNAQNAAGTTSSGTAGGAIFNLPSSAAGAAAQISVAATGPTAIATAGPGEGVNGTTNAAALANLANVALVNGQTGAAYFGTYIGTLGNLVAGASTAQTADAAATTQAQTQRDSYSAVSLDDEASMLTQYQRAYEAAAKVFSIVNSVMGSAINLGTETAV